MEALIYVCVEIRTTISKMHPQVLWICIFAMYEDINKIGK